MRNLKVLVGLALTAVLAFSAMGAATASADELTAESYPTVLTGKLDPGATTQLVTTVATTSCNDASLSATITGATTSISAAMGFWPCATGGMPTFVQMNGCTFTFNFQGGSSTTGDADLNCPLGQEFTLAIGSPTLRCTIHIKPQSDITGTVTLSNLGAGATREVTMNSELTGIDYTHTAGTGLGKCTTGSATNGTLNMKSLVQGETHAGTHVGIFMSNV